MCAQPARRGKRQQGMASIRPFMRSCAVTCSAFAGIRLSVFSFTIGKLANFANQGQSSRGHMTNTRHRFFNERSQNANRCEG